MNIRSVPLGEIATIGAGQGAPQDKNAFSTDGQPFIRAASLEVLCNGGSDYSLEKISESSAAKYRLRLYPKGTVVFAKSGMSATKNRVYQIRKPAYVVNHLATVEPSEKLDPTFLRYWFECLNPTSLIQDTAYPSISQEKIEAVQIPLPPLLKQQRIAELLEQADRLCRTRRYALELSDTFLSAVFLEFFGDDFQASSIAQLGDLVKITGGGTPSREHTEFFQGQIPWLTSKDMHGDYIWDTEEHITEDAINNSATNLVPVNSILVVVKSKVLMHRLPVAIAKVPMCHGQDIKSIQCLKGLHHEFARYVLRHHERRLLNIARGANTEGLTLPMLKELPIPQVDFDKQLKFASLVERHERLRATQRETLRQSEHLFQTLLHRVFVDRLAVEVPALSLVSQSSPQEIFSRRHAIACYIVDSLHQSQTFGRTQLMKCLYSTEAHLNIDLGGHYERQAAGPFDKSIYLLEKEAKRQRWFDSQGKQTRKGYSQTRYSLLPALRHKVDEAVAILGDKRKEFDRILTLFKPLTTREAEIIATLFAAWNDDLMQNRYPTDEQIIREVLENWHEAKARFSRSELQSWLNWMRGNHFVPKGTGPRTIPSL